MSHEYYGNERRHSPDHCPMTPDQVKTMLDNQKKLIDDVAELKRYLFAGRVAFATLAGLALSFDWVREHLPLIKNLFESK